MVERNMRYELVIARRMRLPGLVLQLGPEHCLRIPVTPLAGQPHSPQCQPQQLFNLEVPTETSPQP